MKQPAGSQTRTLPSVTDSATASRTNDAAIPPTPKAGVALTDPGNTVDRTASAAPPNTIVNAPVPQGEALRRAQDEAIKDDSENNGRRRKRRETPPPDPAKPARRASADPTNAKPTPTDPALTDALTREREQKVWREAIPREWQNKLLDSDGTYVLRADPKSTVFTARETEVQTRLNDPAVARMLVATVDERGWNSITLKGTERFRREVWMEATARGIQVSGYRAKEVDYMEMNRRTRQFEGRNRIEADQKALANLPVDTIARRDAGARNAATAIAATERFVEQALPDQGERDRVNAAVRERIAEAGAHGLRKVNLRPYEGQVVDFGFAPYKFDSTEDRSFYVKLQQGRKERIVWGIGLADAITAASVEPGDSVRLYQDGRVPVSVAANVRNDQNQVIGRKTIETERIQWVADVTQRREPEPRERSRGRTR